MSCLSFLFRLLSLFLIYTAVDVDVAVAVDVASTLPDSTTDTAQLVPYGMELLTSSDIPTQLIGLSYFSRALHPSATPKPYTMNDPQGLLLAMWSGRVLWNNKLYSRAQHFFDLASTAPWEIAGDCPALMSATSRLAIAAHASSPESSSTYLREHENLVSSLLLKSESENSRGSSRSLSLSRSPLDPRTGQNGDFGKDSYVYCLLSSFYLESLFDADFARVASEYSTLALKTFPFLNFTSPSLKTLDPDRDPGTRIRIGVASALLKQESSVGSDFNGVLQRLPADKFELHIIFLKENWTPLSQKPAGIRDWPNVGSVHDVEYVKMPLGEDGVPPWLEDARDYVGSLDLDIM